MSIRWLALIPGLLAAPTSAKKSVEDIYRAARPAVVVVTSGNSLGSGFVADARGLVLTSNHVVTGHSVTVKFDGDGEAVAAEVVARNPDADLAVLALPVGRKYRTVPLASTGPRVGQEIAVIGNPLGLEATISTGIVSGIRDHGSGQSMIQISAAVSPGSSGGPVLDLGGTVIAVATAQIVDGQNLNFAVPISVGAELIKKSRRASNPETASASAEEVATCFRGFWDASYMLNEGKRDTSAAVDDAGNEVDSKLYVAVETMFELRNRLDRHIADPALRPAQARLRSAIDRQLESAFLYEQGWVTTQKSQDEFERSKTRRAESWRESASAAQMLLPYLRGSQTRAWIARASILYSDVDYPRFSEFSEELGDKAVFDWAFWWMAQERRDLARDSCELGFGGPDNMPPYVAPPTGISWDGVEPSDARFARCLSSLAAHAAKNGHGDLATKWLHEAVEKAPKADVLRQVVQVVQALIETGQIAAAKKALGGAEKALRRSDDLLAGVDLLPLYRATGRRKEGVVLLSSTTWSTNSVAAAALQVDLENLVGARSLLEAANNMKCCSLQAQLAECVVIGVGREQKKLGWTQGEYSRCIDRFTVSWSAESLIARKPLTIEAEPDAARLKIFDAKIHEAAAERAKELVLRQAEEDEEGRVERMKWLGKSIALGGFLREREGIDHGPIEASAVEVAAARELLQETVEVLMPARVEAILAAFDEFAAGIPAPGPN